LIREREMSFTLNKSGSLEYMTADNISVRHAFTTRRGGESQGIYSSLNLLIRSEDDREALQLNYKKVCEELGTCPERLVFSKQVHKDCVRLATKADCRGELFNETPYEADALITAERDLPLVIFIADCIPILLHDPLTPAIGAVHAGWRGTAQDIAGKAVSAMCREFGSKPENIKAAVGQGISFCCFETGKEVPEALRALLGSEAEEFIKENDGGKAMVDLKGVNRLLLLRRGLLPENIEVSTECTSCSSDKYWSHRVTKGLRGVNGAFIII
jgi:YfiH family protein